MIERKTIISCKKKREREKKEERQEVEFRSNILGNLWGQEVLLLLEQGTSSFGPK